MMKSGAGEKERPLLRLVPAPPASSRKPRVDPALDDSELLAALRNGDTTAAMAFHDRVRPQVDRTIRRLLGARDSDADDVAQLALIGLVTTIDRYRGECSLDAWTSTITAHVIYKHIRRRRTERKIFGAVVPEDLELASPRSESRRNVARDVVRRVMVHLDQVEEGRAWAFVLHDVCGYDLREVAQITGVSVAAAQARLVRGRRDVHDRIAADPELALRLTDLESMP
jgi:RNA polymerase sigma-70 factor (ECF subfamily)